MSSRNGNAVRSLWGIVGAVILLSGAAALAFLLQELAPPGGPSGAPRAGQLFDPSTVWTARLRVEPDQWDAMEPAGGMPPFGTGGPGSQAGPAFGPGGPPALSPHRPPATSGRVPSWPRSSWSRAMRTTTVGCPCRRSARWPTAGSPTGTRTAPASSTATNCATG